jgi:hypothetical protein
MEICTRNDNSRQAVKTRAIQTSFLACKKSVKKMHLISSFPLFLFSCLSLSFSQFCWPYHDCTSFFPLYHLIFFSQEKLLFFCKKMKISLFVPSSVTAYNEMWCKNGGANKRKVKHSLRDARGRLFSAISLLFSFFCQFII